MFPDLRRPFANGAGSSTPANRVSTRAFSGRDHYCFTLKSRQSGVHQATPVEPESSGAKVNVILDWANELNRHEDDQLESRGS